MCIAFFEWTEDRFVVCHNRDEFFARPTTNIAWWPSTNDERWEILAPRDAVAGGTWFGFEKTAGRCAFMTNIRELDSNKYASSRGELAVNYLKSDPNLSAMEYLQQEFGSDGTKAIEYAGFNLVVFSGHDLAYISNRNPENQLGPIALEKGTRYGLSNSVLQEPYAKTQKGLNIFEEILDRALERNNLLVGLERLMRREEYCPGDSLPRTGEPGFPVETVKRRSSICVPNVDGYGTRTSILFLLEQWQAEPKQHLLTCIEHNWNLDTQEWDTSMDLHCTISL